MQLLLVNFDELIFINISSWLNIKVHRDEINNLPQNNSVSQEAPQPRVPQLESCLHLSSDHSVEWVMQGGPVVSCSSRRGPENEKEKKLTEIAFMKAETLL